MSVITGSGERGWGRFVLRGRKAWLGPLLFVVWALCIAGCGGDDTNVPQPGGDAAADAKPDQKGAGGGGAGGSGGTAGSGGGNSDAKSDVSPDVVADRGADT